jgi:hypothetical protein
MTHQRNLTLESFLSRVRDELERSDWDELKDFPERPRLVMSKKPGRLDRSLVVMAFFKGDGLSTDEFRAISHRMLEALRGMPAPPVVIPPFVGVLGPRVGIPVFVFEENLREEARLDQLPNEGKASDPLMQIHVVPWTVDLARRGLMKHRGAPIVASGEREIQSALAVEQDKS